MSSATRWGIVSAGSICSDFVSALSVPPAGASEHHVVAVAARELQRAREFANRHNIDKFYGDYLSLANDEEVDVVYVGAINTAHKEVVVLMLQRGKNVVCEKPMALNLRESNEMVKLAREKNVFLMEAMWSWFQPSHLKVRELLSSIGSPMKTVVDFCRHIPIDRLHKKELGGGVILDLGVYAAYFARLVYNGEEAMKNVAIGHLNAEGVDDDVTITLEYKNGKTAIIMLSSRVDSRCDVSVYGSKGFVRLPFPWWCSPILQTNERTYEFQLPDLPANFPNSAGLAYEAQHVRECLLKGLKESPVITLDDTLAIAKLLESWRRQVGVVFPQDQQQHGEGEALAHL